VSGPLHGQLAVVAGGTRGLGRAISLDLLAQGARVCSTWNNDEEAAAAFAAEANERFDGRLRLARFDVADHGAVQAFWRQLDEEEPAGVQVLVHSAGIRRDGIAAMLSREDWQAVLDVNLSGTFHMAKHATLAMLRRRYGRIVILTSPAARHGFEGQANYSASKAGQIGMMRSLAREVARRGITVNCVSPGFADTELLGDLPPQVREAHVASVPMRRFAEPGEVAYAVRSLVLPEASYITGAVLDVTGGL
jgi:3-oxoacyl-[acyl-carrier protein] reductase